MNRFLVLKSQLLDKLVYEQEKEDLSNFKLLRINKKNLERLEESKFVDEKKLQEENEKRLFDEPFQFKDHQIEEFRFPRLKGQVYLAVMMGQQDVSQSEQVLGFYIAYRARERMCDREALKFQKFIHFNDEWKEYQIRVTVNEEFSECISLEQMIQEKMLRSVRKMEFQPGDMVLIDLQIKAIIEKYFENCSEINVNFEKFYQIKYQIEYKNIVRDELLFDYEFFE